MSALGHWRTSASRSEMSALPPKADMLIVGINAAYVPQADISLLAARPPRESVVRPNGARLG